MKKENNKNIYINDYQLTEKEVDVLVDALKQAVKKEKTTEQIYIIKELVDRLEPNVSLKFEEIYDGQVIWDSVEKKYFKVQETFYDLNGIAIMVPWGTNDKRRFEKNRFYLKEPLE